MRITTTLVTLAVFAGARATLYNCIPLTEDGKEYLTEDGSHYDLSPLSRKDGEPDWVAGDKEENGKYIYTINVCAPIHSISQAIEKHAAVFQQQNGTVLNPDPNCVASDDETGCLKNDVDKCAGVASASTMRVAEDNAIELKYTNGDVCFHNRVQRSSLIRFICDKNVPEDNPPFAIGEDECLYMFEWQTPYACPIKPDKDKGMSGAAIFFLVVFLSLLAYLTIGFAYNRFVRGARGAHQIPNYEFWSHISSSITTCCTRSFSGDSRRPAGDTVYRGLDDSDNDEDDERILETA